MKNINRSQVIQAIDIRASRGEYDNFIATKNRLVVIRGKLLHNNRLSKNDLDTLTLEGYI